jgi:CBS domain-containing protein
VRRGLRIPQEYEADVLKQVTVAEVMDQNPATVPALMPLSELADHIARGTPEYTRRQGLPILDDEGKLAGIITRGDVLRTLEESSAQNLTVLEAGSDSLVVTYPDEPVHEAVTKMLHNDIGRLVVVSRDDPKTLLGYLGRGAVLEARLQRLREESEREQGWLRLPVKPAGARVNRR